MDVYSLEMTGQTWDGYMIEISMLINRFINYRLFVLVPENNII